MSPDLALKLIESLDSLLFMVGVWGFCIGCGVLACGFLLLRISTQLESKNESPQDD